MRSRKRNRTVPLLGAAVLCALLIWMPAGTSALFAEEEPFSGRLFLEGGWSDPASPVSSFYPYARLSLASHQDLDSSLSLGLSGEAQWQSSLATPSWPLYQMDNLVSLETKGLIGSGGDFSYYSLRLSRAYLQWASGRLEITGGLQDFSWGSSFFYRPTNYFFPLLPLTWTRNLPLGSEALDTKCFLFDNLSLEGAVRWLSGGEAEWVARVVHRGIGLTVAPSFARLRDRNGLGLEGVMTFPDFQARFEEVNWFYPDGSFKWEGVAGLSTVKEGVTGKLELFWDGRGEVLGGFAPAGGTGTYLFASVERDFPGEWKAAPSFVKPLDGGPLLFWPKLSWGFSSHWEAALQAQVTMGDDPGPLSLLADRVGISLSYDF